VDKAIIKKIEYTFGKKCVAELKAKLQDRFLTYEDFERFVADYCVMAFLDLCEEYEIVP
jgi:hypothetical protein